MVQNIEIRIMRSQDLHPYLSELNVLINEAYSGQDYSSYGGEALFSGLRIKSHDQLVHELGSAGIIALAFDARHDEQTNKASDDAAKPKDQLVAVGAIKPWKGKTVDLWEAQKAESVAKGVNDIMADPESTADEHSSKLLERMDWEINACASRKDPRYRGQGLVTRCLDVLVRYLQESRRQAFKESVPEISLWITALEGVGNVEYWQRRGFVRQGEPDDAPVGLWGAKRPFKIGTLRKTVT